MKTFTACLIVATMAGAVFADAPLGGLGNVVGGVLNTVDGVLDPLLGTNNVLADLLGGVTGGGGSGSSSCTCGSGGGGGSGGSDRCKLLVPTVLCVGNTDLLGAPLCNLLCSLLTCNIRGSCKDGVCRCNPK